VDRLDEYNNATDNGKPRKPPQDRSDCRQCDDKQHQQNAAIQIALVVSPQRTSQSEYHSFRKRSRTSWPSWEVTSLVSSDVPSTMPEAPRLSDPKRALRWLRAQYQRRAEEAARGQDRMIECIRKAKVKKIQ
jgi:hypothetical protein